jgi:hypothetical protein
MKWYEKIWQWLTLFLAGIIAGIFVFIKFLDQPEYQVLIKKIKNKKNSGPISNTIDIEQLQPITENKQKRKIRIFNRNKK